MEKGKAKELEINIRSDERTSISKSHYDLESIPPHEIASIF
jgi:hypothetical protein